MVPRVAVEEYRMLLGGECIDRTHLEAGDTPPFLSFQLGDCILVRPRLVFWRKELAFFPTDDGNNIE